MQSISIRFIALTACLALAPAVRGQGLLDKLEENVKNPLKGGEPKPAAEPAPPADVGDEPPPAVPTEAPKSGYLGVVLNDSTGSIVVEEIAKDSPAAKAGLKAGDRITAANKAIVNTIEELGVVMEPLPPGENLSLSVVRSGKPMTIEATLGDPPPEPARPGAAEIELGGPLGPGTGELPPPNTAGESVAPRAEGGVQRASLGITVITYNDELRRRSDVPSRSGAMISMIRPDSPAARAGLPLGGVIVAYDGQKVETADELVDFIRTSRPGQEVELTYFQGPSLRRKSITLAAAADPGLLGPGYGSLLKDRPLLNRVERAIEGLTHPGGAPGTAPAAIGEAPGDAASLRSEVEILKAKVATLESKLAEIEAKLAAEAPGAAPAVANPADTAPTIPKDDGPPSVVPSTRRPPTKAPGIKIGDE